MKDFISLAVVSVLGVAVIISALIGVGALWANVGVYTSELHGKAEFKKAEWSRQIAGLDAQAEVARAEGVAKANSIIGEGLRNNEAYLTYLYIQNLAGHDNQIIYVPTEAGLPVLEANRLLRE